MWPPWLSPRPGVAALWSCDGDEPEGPADGVVEDQHVLEAVARDGVLPPVEQPVLHVQVVADGRELVVPAVGAADRGRHEADHDEQAHRERAPLAEEHGDRRVLRRRAQDRERRGGQDRDRPRQ